MSYNIDHQQDHHHEISRLLETLSQYQIIWLLELYWTVIFIIQPNTNIRICQQLNSNSYNDKHLKTEI